MIPLLDPLTIDVGERIRTLRTRAGESQRSLGQRACVHPMHIMALEQGRMSPNARTLGRIAGALDVTPADLLNVDSELGEIYELLREHPGLVTRLKNALTLRT